ncbi:alpha/beta hydrolase [Sulfurospirillum cavolei]|uniref:alpha/beta hydrolase n=1 Tax=Sulfurospirillum cavolei TaxID=366522 RepID=UPI003FA1AC44
MAKYSLSILLLFMSFLHAHILDIPTRDGVSERIMFRESPAAKAAVILFAGGHGGIQLKQDGTFGWGEGNFLMRTRELFVDAHLTVVIVDAPSDRQREPYLNGFRQSKEHVQDIQNVIDWVKTKTNVPIWLVGTSRGTQSVAYAATHGIQGVSGFVLTSTILSDPKSDAVPQMPLEKISMPVLVVHHANDGCVHCSPSLIDTLMKKVPFAELIMIQGGKSQGDPCMAYAYHGFNGVESETLSKIADWIIAH